jgi:hypothetical protein
MTKDHSTVTGPRTCLRRQGQREALAALPDVLRALFDASGHVSIQDALQALDVAVVDGTIIEVCMNRLAVHWS